MPIVLQSPRGAFRKTSGFLKRMSTDEITSSLVKYGEVGVAALMRATPQDTGLSAASWSYQVSLLKGFWTLSWHNQNGSVNGKPIVILLQYGHGTGTGGYVAGQDFINPAIQPIFDKILTDIRKEVRFK